MPVQLGAADSVTATAGTPTDLALLQRSLADHPGARSSVTRALAITRAIFDRCGEAEALTCLGALLLDVRDRDAVVHHRRALRIARDVHCPLEEARALEGIGHCLALTAGPEGGSSELRQALAIYERLGVPEASRLMAIGRGVRSL